MPGNDDHLNIEELLAAVEEEALSSASASHLERCTRCKTEVFSLRQVRAGLTPIPNQGLSDLLRRRLIARFEQRESEKPLVMRMLTWPIPLYQVASFLAALLLLWKLTSPSEDRASRISDFEPPVFQVAVAELLIGP